MGTVDGCGYDDQLKYTLCDAYRPCHSILRILKPFIRQLRQICCIFESLRCLNLKIWRFLVDDDNNDTTDYFTPCACARDNNGAVQFCCSSIQWHLAWICTHTSRKSLTRVAEWRITLCHCIFDAILHFMWFNEPQTSFDVRPQQHFKILLD